MKGLNGTTISGLKRMLDSHELSPKELHSWFMPRIETYDTKLNSYVEKVDFAAGSTEAAKEGLLAGIPLALKDNYCTKGIRTTASSNVLKDYIPPYDATVVSRLKAAGAVILGKTNMDAWAHGSSTETSDFGPTTNPWDTTRVPGGSSGGSAAAVSAYLCPASMGSETAGSIRLPASWCGVIGLKPSYGRVSRYGVIAMGSSLDCPGPFTVSVEDAALILQVIAGKDPFDATTADVPVPDYRKQMQAKSHMTIGISHEYMEGLEPDVQKNLEEMISLLKKMGHTIQEVSLMSPEYAISVYTIIQRAEVSSNLARYDGIRYGTNRTFLGTEGKKRIMLGTYTLSHGYYDAFYKKAQKVRTLIIEDFRRVFKEVDVILATPTPVPALKLGEFEKYPFFGEKMDMLNEPSAIAGIPAISIPSGLDSNGLPLAVQFMGNYFEEGRLLDIAHQVEKETGFFDVITKGISRYA